MDSEAFFFLPTDPQEEGFLGRCQTQEASKVGILLSRQFCNRWESLLESETWFDLSLALFCWSPP